MPEPTSTRIVQPSALERAILQVRGHRVMLDLDLAALYEVEVKALNQAVRRNAARFPEDFMFQLTSDESRCLRSQIVTAKVGRGGRRTPPYAFTEQGVLEVLEARGIPVGDDQRATVLACSDRAVLHRWLIRAATVGSADDLFAL
jgi:hypothetical protein